MEGLVSVCPLLPPGITDPYAVLGLTQDRSASEVREADDVSDVGGSMRLGYKVSEASEYSRVTSYTVKTLTKAYRVKALALHPDKNPDDPLAGEKFDLLTKAFDFLTDTQNRAVYDEWVKRKEEKKKLFRKVDKQKQQFASALHKKEQEGQCNSSSDWPHMSTTSSRSRSGLAEDEVKRIRRENEMRLHELQRLRVKKAKREKKRMNNGRIVRENPDKSEMTGEFGNPVGVVGGDREEPTSDMRFEKWNETCEKSEVDFDKRGENESESFEEKILRQMREMGQRQKTGKPG
eukprot:GHVN01030162.1.p1 GENE.GHVN01030162.1~~GHVN01030162.1.p1  ORF type:complete len:291 (+),score=90.10 GHVN01030162.1:173-1045(+)